MLSPYADAEQALLHLALSVRSGFDSGINHNFARTHFNSDDRFRLAPYIRSPHRGLKFRENAIALVQRARKVEDHNTALVKHAGHKITQHCGGNPLWLQNKDILRLWHDLAHIVTNFSDHPDPDKRVAALILETDGELLDFSANAIPRNFPLDLVCHDEKGRSKTRNCAEISASGRRLGIEAPTPDFKNLTHEQCEIAIQNAVSLQRLNINTATQQTGSQLQGKIILVTHPPCNGCAEPISHAGLAGIIIPSSGGENFRRISGMHEAKERLSKSVRIIDLHQAVFV